MPQTPAPAIEASALAQSIAHLSDVNAEAAAFSFSISEATVMQGPVAFAAAMGFAEAGHFAAGALQDFLSLAEHAVVDIEHALERLLSGHSARHGEQSWTNAPDGHHAVTDASTWTVTHAAAQTAAGSAFVLSLIHI